MSMKLTCGEFVGLAYANDDELREFAEEILAENAKLREELEQWHRLTAGIKLPEYPITEFKPKDLERENAKLREMCTALYRCRDKISECATCEDVACPFTDDCMLHNRARAENRDMTMGEDNGIYGIDKLAELLIARGIELYVMDECSLISVDGKGNLHECCKAGAAEDLVNVMVVTTPEEALSVTDLNGVIAENTRLRELVRMYGEYTDQDRCEGCVCKSRCNDGDMEECWQLTEIRGLERELGIG